MESTASTASAFKPVNSTFWAKEAGKKLIASNALSMSDLNFFIVTSGYAVGLTRLRCFQVACHSDRFYRGVGCCLRLTNGKEIRIMSTEILAKIYY